MRKFIPEVKFEGEIENFILNTFISFKSVKRFENRSGVNSVHFFRSVRALKLRQSFRPKVRYRNSVWSHAPKHNMAKGT